MYGKSLQGAISCIFNGNFRKYCSNSTAVQLLRMCPLEIQLMVEPGGPVVIATGSEVRGFKPGRGGWIFSGLKNPE